MKAKICSTSAVVDMKDIHGNPFTARVWEGETEGGVAFTAYIPVVQVRSAADNSQFIRELQQHRSPSTETQHAIDARFVI